MTHSHLDIQYIKRESHPTPERLQTICELAQALQVGNPCSCTMQSFTYYEPCAASLVDQVDKSIN